MPKNEVVNISSKTYALKKIKEKIICLNVYPDYLFKFILFLWMNNESVAVTHKNWIFKLKFKF